MVYRALSSGKSRILQHVTPFLLLITLTLSATAQPGDALNVKNNSNGVVTVFDGGDIEEVKSITVEAWVKANSFNGLGRIAIRPDGEPNTNGQNFVNESTFFLGFGSSGKPRFAVQIDDRSDATKGVHDVTLNNSINTGQWYHLAGTYDHTNGDFKIYVNGELKHTSTPSAFIGSTDRIVEAASGSGIVTSIHLGASDIGLMNSVNEPNNGKEYPFDGELDEVRIWDDVRTQEEIKDQMHQQVNVNNVNNLVHYYRFNSTNSSSNYPDNSSSNSAEGTPKNGASKTSSDQAITDDSKINGSAFNDDPRGIWPPNTTASSGGLTISEKSTATLSAGDDVIVGNEGSSGENTSPKGNNYNSNISGVNASDLDAVAEREWFVDENAGGKNIDLTFNTSNAGIGNMPSTANAGDYVLIEVNSSSNDELIQKANSVTSSNNAISFDDVNINSTYTFGTTDDNNSSLPVELTSFEVSRQGEHSGQLSWSTASETNNKHFLVQRRVDDQWQQAGRVKGHGTTTVPQDYRFTDNNLTPGTHYYRLKQVDFDGSYEYSEVKALTIKDERGEGITLAPNPVQDNLRVAVGSQFDGRSAQLVIHNAYGQQVYQGTVTLEEGQRQQVLSLNHLKPGAYILRLRSAEETVQKRFIKEE